jgi:DNA-binding CsgD family transcriptional regulator/PAS domain-containing protein
VPKLDLAELSAGLYEAALNIQLIPAAMENIAQSLGCYSYHQMTLDTNTHQVTMGWTGDVVPDSVQAAYEQHYIQLDDRPLQAFAAGVGGIFVSTDSASAATIDRSEIYQDFLIPNGVKHCMGGMSFEDDKRRMLVAFLGAADRDEFSTQERHLLKQLMPHLQRSAALMLRVQALERLEKEGRFILENLPTAAFTLSAQNNVLSINKRAESLFVQGHYFGTSQQKLFVKGPMGNEFVSLLKRVTKTGTPESMVLAALNMADTIHATVSRFPQASQSAGQSAKLLVLISQPNHYRVASLQQLMQLFKFSPAEARLARAVAHGQELESFALEQGVKMTTIRSQMAAIFTKAQVKRQTELAKLILSIPCARPTND